MLNVWLLALVGLFVALTRDEDSEAAVAGRGVAVVVLGAYLARLTRKPGWLPRT